MVSGGRVFSAITLALLAASRAFYGVFAGLLLWPPSLYHYITKVLAWHLHDPLSLCVFRSATFTTLDLHCSMDPTATEWAKKMENPHKVKIDLNVREAASPQSELRRRVTSFTLKEVFLRTFCNACLMSES